MRILAYLLLFIFLYRFIVRFVLPVLHITRSVNDRLGQMQQKADERNQGQPPVSRPSGIKKGDYIDYEEIK